MTVAGQGTGADRDQGPASFVNRRTVDLETIRQPYGPCPAALDALVSGDVGEPEVLAARLRRRISATYRVPAEAVNLFPGVDAGIVRLLGQTTGSIVSFPPSSGIGKIEGAWPERGFLHITRGLGRNGALTAELAADIPPDAVACIASPADPLGNLLAPADAVRLSRACRWLIVDERYAEFAGQSLLSLAADFENIVVLRSFEVWAGLDGSPCAWAVLSSRAATCLGTPEPLPRAGAMAAAQATLENLRAVEATLRLVREERSRLYRLLRKLSYLEPAPTWGPFLAARAALSGRDEIVDGLRRRGVNVHAPTLPALCQFIRFGIGSRSDMEQLRLALLDLAPEITA